MGDMNKMENDKFSSDAFECIFRRYIKDDPKRVASFQEELVKSEIAREIYDLRNKAGLTRQELARLAGTAVSVIEDIEEADYEGNFLLTAARIASALQRRVEVRFVEDQPNESQRISI
jgi:ribosome-binding protein aMBF1 (putative translation factor)